MTPSADSFALRRSLLGLIALALLIGWGVLKYIDPQEQEHAAAMGICSRCGLILGVVWLALPDAVQLRNKLWLALTALSIAVIAWRPRLFPVVAVLFVLIALLRPRRKPVSPAPRR